HVFPRFDIFPQNEYIFFLQGDNQIIDHKDIRAKRPQLIQSETYADAQGAITKQFGRYSELHNQAKYKEQDQFDRITQLTKQTITTPDGKPFLPRIEPDVKFFGGLQKKLGKLKLKNPLFKDLINNPSFSLLPINTMSPNPTNGGTVNSTNYVTFNGSGFGSQDAVFYANADDGGQTMVASSYATDVLSWSGSSVEEKVHQNAGTGPVKINNITSSNDLEINWSHNCLYNSFSGFTQDTRQKYFLADMNNSGGYTFTYNTSFNNNGPAKAAFERALETWRCGTYMNWAPSNNTTSISSAANDNVNIITFNSGIAAGVLGRSYSYFSGTATGVCDEENTLWWMREMDIEFDSPPSPTFAWNFGPAASVPFASTYDLESVSLHELGHLHGLGHTISFFGDAMHYSLQSGADKRILSVNDEAGGDAKMVYSTDADDYCFFPNTINGELIALTNSNCSLTGGCATIAVNITGNSEFCEGESTNLDAGTYSIGDSYIWSTNATSQIITVTAAGTYTVTVTDNNGCTGTGSFTVSQNDAPQPNIEGTLSYCEGEQTNLDAGAFYSSYLWSTGEISFAITVTSPATYTLIVTDENGCEGTDEVIVVANPLPQPEITGEDGFCPGETAEIFAGSGFTNYLWNTGETTPIINVDTQGDYTVTVTNENDCTNSDTFVVFANAAPTPEIEGDTFFCNGEDTFVFVEDGLTSYIWSDGTITFGTNIEESGTYTVMVTDNNGCTGIDEIIVVEQPVPNPNIMGNLQICTGNTTTLTSADGFSNYIWSTGSNSNQITVSEAGTYTVTVTNNNDCTGTQAVTVVLIPELQPTIVGNLEICEGESTLISLSESYNTYLWSNNESASNI
ncbi:MAG: matrixin family metalloprotease, partial [Chitinophagales bacterium]